MLVSACWLPVFGLMQCNLYHTPIASQDLGSRQFSFWLTQWCNRLAVGP